jgi:hypothetical protein
VMPLVCANAPLPSVSDAAAIAETIRFVFMLSSFRRPLTDGGPLHGATL